jgi:hypothetical protein
MRGLAAGCSALVAVCVFASRGLALTPVDDMCSQPKMKTDKWQSRSEVGGMTILIPPGFTAGGHSAFAETADSHFYNNGEHRSISIGSGRQPSFIARSSDIAEERECETVIAGRRVTLTKFRWVQEDANLSASGHAGSTFIVVARFYAAGPLREVYAAFSSESPSDFNYFRQLFWTISFPGTAASVAASSADATAGGSPASITNVANVSSAAAPVTCAPVPGLPAPDAVLDSALVRSLLASAAPIPAGFEIMALKFSGSGELSGMSVAQSDLPEASQHELASVVATNLKTQHAQEPSTFLLRIDSSDTGLRYAVLPISGCSH